ncbi:hypothetical protein T4E_7545 [Trichinella pseudospiralis]|uniref:Uncharacterized protein n=1 Tax=Trichinella pseudospiralis TaxID=6337 RepID=A0A0V0YLM5_TRIPS|nr:hypothetical protein T4E_7545 [Trichinella pseudospiralis]
MKNKHPLAPRTTSGRSSVSTGTDGTISRPSHQCFPLFTIQVKMLLQTLWQRGTSWEDLLSIGFMEQWTRWNQVAGPAEDPSSTRACTDRTWSSETTGDPRIL